MSNHVGFYIIKDNTQKTSFYYDYAKLALEKAQINNTQNVNFAFYDESFIQQIQISNYYVKELPRALKEHGRMMIQSIASENGKIETRFDGPGTQKGWEYFASELDVLALAKANAQKVIMYFEILS